MASRNLRIVDNPYGPPFKAPGRAGSEEQHLDMCETGPLKGDNLLREAGGEETRGWMGLDNPETIREGAEMSGDDHSSGWQGDDEEWSGEIQEDGMPGDENRVEQVKLKQTHIPEEID